MRNKKRVIIAVSLLLVISTGIGVVAVIQCGGGNTNTPAENETVEWTGSDELFGGELFGTEPNFQFEHITGDASVHTDKQPAVVFVGAGELHKRREPRAFLPYLLSRLRPPGDRLQPLTYGLGAALL